MAFVQRLTLLTLCSILLLPAVQGEDETSRPGLAMAKAAVTFRGLLTDELKKKLSYSFDDPERVNWHFIPRERNGVVLWDLEGESRAAADELVKSGLSAAGYLTTLQIRSLEEVLYLFEGGEEEYRRQRRHTHKYHITIFGEPSENGTWGWRFEGHHLSLNFVIRDGVIVSSTPEMLGTNPALIDAGPGRSLRVLGTREDLARSILLACNDSQKKAMWISPDAPDEIRGPGEAQPVVGEAVGLRYAEMSPDQQKLFRELIGEYVKGMPAQVVRDRMQAIEKSGMDNIRMGWWGDAEPNKRHHYVIQGSSFVIEYNNTQNSANHVHSIWRNLAGDFALPAGK